MLSARRARQLFALHRWTGVWTGLVIMFLSVTGAIVVFNAEIDEWLNPELLVTSPQAGARDVGIDTALRNAREQSPDLSIDAVTPPLSRTGVYAVWMTDDDGGFYQATVDPYTGSVLGQRNYKASFQDVMRQLHVRFFAFGWQGRVVVGAFGLTLLVSTLTGFLIYGRFIKALPHWWSIRRGRGLQISASDWHKLIGILTLAFNLLIAATGTVLGLENLARFSPAVGEAIHPGPGDGVLAKVPETLEGAIPASVAIARVRTVIDGFKPRYVVLPKAGVGHYQLLGDLPDRIEMTNASGAVVHALTGEVLYRHSAREARLITKTYNWMDPLHFGTFGGVATRVLWVLLGLASGILSISGFLIWWLKTRRRPRRGRRGRVPPAPAAEDQASVERSHVVNGLEPAGSPAVMPSNRDEDAAAEVRNRVKQTKLCERNENTDHRNGGEMRSARPGRLMAPIFLLLVGTGSPSSLDAQTFRSEDPVLQQMWVEGMERSSAGTLAQALTDSIGPRLSGSPGFEAAGDWLLSLYEAWGVAARRKEYGTWLGWRQGTLHVDLVAPRVQTLEAKLLAWSPGTAEPVEAETALIPELASAEAVDEWLPTVAGKVVLASPPEPTCREPQALEALARAETMESLRAERQELRRSWSERLERLGPEGHRLLEDAGAVAVVTSRWSEGWGVNKIFSAQTAEAVSIDVSCEDYGLLYRLTENEQGARIRIDAEAEELGEVPMFNVIAEIPGTELPNEHVILSAHLDSWHGATGATDNATGTITMLEAMRILRATYPNPRRTILVGHWGGEEQGLIGSRAFTEDHPEIVENLQALFNQDNGTWRVDYIQTQGLAGASGNLARWVAELPVEISEHIELDLPGPQEVGGSDHVSFLCHGAPGWRLQSHYPDYRQYTWHTNRDTYDKIILDDLKNNATLAAMLAYLASEDPERVPRDRAVLPPDPSTGQPREWLPCGESRRSWDG